MEIVVDTNILIRAERQGLGFIRLDKYSEVFISVITCSELLVGIHHANSEARRRKRSIFVEAMLNKFPILNFTLDVARTHAELRAAIPKNLTVGPHDLIIAATAMHYGMPVMTGNANEFSMIPGLTVLSPTADTP